MKDELTLKREEQSRILENYSVVFAATINTEGIDGGFILRDSVGELFTVLRYSNGLFSKVERVLR